MKTYREGCRADGGYQRLAALAVLSKRGGTASGRTGDSVEGISRPFPIPKSNYKSPKLVREGEN